MAMPNIRFGYSVKKNSFKGLDIDCIQYSNIIRITYYSYSYSGTILNPNIIRIRIRPNIFARILFVFVFAHSEKNKYYSYSYSVKILMPNIIRIRIRSIKQYSLTSDSMAIQFKHRKLSMTGILPAKFSNHPYGIGC